MSFCTNCVHEGRGRALSESEARIHQDNFPDHNVVSANEEDVVVSE